MTGSLIFDVGEVLIHWEPRRLFRTLLPDDAAVETFLDEVGFAAWNDGFDRGEDWDQSVAAHSARHPEYAPVLEAYHKRWAETVTGPVEGMPAYLAELHAAGVPLYAITNFSGPTFAQTVVRFPFLATSFRDIVVSGHERLIKPDPEIFRRCLARNNLVAGDCVFIDDRAGNIAAARALGIDGIRFTDAMALRRELAARGFPG